MTKTLMHLTHGSEQEVTRTRLCTIMVASIIHNENGDVYLLFVNYVKEWGAKIRIVINAQDFLGRL